jgi:protein-L-isoaspartate(D-aspartate) O-methyltransferase
MLLVKRRSHVESEARFLGPVWFYEFSRACDAEVNDRLKQAFAGDRGAAAKSVRRDRHAEDETCWLCGEGWCLSRRELQTV